MYKDDDAIKESIESWLNVKMQYRIDGYDDLFSIQYRDFILSIINDPNLPKIIETLKQEKKVNNFANSFFLEIYFHDFQGEIVYPREELYPGIRAELDQLFKPSWCLICIDYLRDGKIDNLSIGSR